jgi:hypothetical protein
MLRQRRQEKPMPCLTTDDKLIKACTKLNLAIKVINPVTFLLEMAERDEK